MSIAKTLVGSIAGGLALGFGLKLGEGVLRKPLPPAAVPFTHPMETVITAVAQLAEHSGRLESRITALEQHGGLLPALEAQLSARLIALESVIGGHADSIASLEERTGSTEGCWQDLVSRMETICRGLVEQSAPPGVTVIRSRNTSKVKQSV